MKTSILVIGDSYMPVESMRPAVEALGPVVTASYRTVDPNDRPPLPGVTEYQGDPEIISTWIDDHTVLVVHAAAVTRELLERHPQIRLVVCLRGGPVNVDLGAARDLGVAVVNTPGKNAPSVCDLTIAYMHLLLRRVPEARRSLVDKASAGETHLDSTFVGGEWMSREPRGLTLGIVGFGAIGRLVAREAHRYAMRVVAHDPFVSSSSDEVDLVSLDELAAQSDVVTIHAKATNENVRLVDANFLAAMNREAVIINTSRQSLMDERALLSALQAGRIAGAALDVCEPDGAWPQLVALPNVMITPHLGGATAQTQQRGLEMGLADLVRFLEGKEPLHRVA